MNTDLVSEAFYLSELKAFSYEPQKKGRFGLVISLRQNRQ